MLTTVENKHLNDAAMQSDHKAIKDALANGAKPTVTIAPDEKAGKYTKADREALLLEGALQGDKKVLEFLTAEEVDLNCRDHRGRTPLFNLMRGGHPELIGFLKQKGADVSLYDSDDKNLAFHAVLHGSLADVIYLEKLGVDLTHTDKYGLNLFHMVSLALTAKLDIAQYLLSKEVDFRAKAKNGMTAITMDIACNKNDKTLFKFYMSLLEKEVEH